MTNLLHNFDYAYSEPAYSTVCVEAYAAAAGIVFAVGRVLDDLPTEYMFPFEGLCWHGKDHDYQRVSKGFADASETIGITGPYRTCCKSHASLFRKKSVYHP